MNKILSFFLIIIILVTSSCDEKSQNKNTVVDNANKAKRFTPIHYAKGFEIEEQLDYKVLTLKNAWKDEKTTHQYVLYKNEPPKNYEHATLIKVPIKKIVCMSVTHIALIDLLNQLNSVVAMTGRNTSSNPIVQKMVENDKIIEVGVSQQLNYELLVDLSPDVVMTYGIDQASNAHINKLNQLGLNVVLNAEYMELHPLGKLEWIKFIAVFYGMEEEANQLFSKIEKEYLELADLTKKVKDKPSVFVGMPWNGSWYIPGGKSFMAQYFKDAGANYLWSENNEQGSYVKSKEVILDEAFEADYWLNLNSYSSKKEVVGYDDRFNNFSAYQNDHLFNYLKQLDNKGRNAYFESGAVNPHIVLKDLIEIFHPEILAHDLVYYKKLE